MTEELSKDEYNDLKKEGYTDGEIKQAINLSTQEAQQGGEIQGQRSAFAYNPSDNLIKWQLELNDILERAEHILREDEIAFGKDNNIYWKKTDGKNRILNDYGVQEIMRILSMYINRNTILSDYDPEEIENKIFDFGKELNDLIFMKYENFGLDTLEKRKNYPMMFIQIKDIVHSSYKRAQHGGERRSLREARQISQTENIIPGAPTGQQYGQNMQQSQRSFLNPMKYIKGPTA